MNKITVLNELRRCVEPQQAGWDIWFRGEYLGMVIKIRTGLYGVLNAHGDVAADVSTNYMSAISKFIDDAIKVHNEQRLSLLYAVLTNEPKIKQIGIREPKSMWQKIKGLFK